MRRLLTVATLSLVCLLGGLLPRMAHAQTAQQALVDRATLTVQDMLRHPDDQNILNLLRRARAVMVCPRVFKAGFILGGSGGGCVLVARAGGGSWSAPAFYSMGSGSIGLQAGIQDSELMMLILTDRGLGAIMDNQFKFGGDASVAVATLGAGIEGDTTAALDADIVAYSHTRGLFAGVSLQGSILSTDTNANLAYYGQALAARQIVMQMQANNAGADPLRAVLTRYGSAVAAPPSAGMVPPGAEATPPGAAYAPQAPGLVRQQSLPPPR